MKWPSFLIQGILFGIAISGCHTSRALAQVESATASVLLEVQKTPQSISRASTTSENHSISAISTTLPDPVEAIQNCQAIAVQALNEIEISVERIERIPMPITLQLVQPITVNNAVVIPAGTLISAQVVPTVDGIQLVADALMVETRLLDFNAASLPIPSRRIEPPPGAQTSPISFGAMGSGIGLLVGGEEGRISGQIVGDLTTVVMTMLSDNSIEVVQIPANTAFILRRQ